MRTSTFRHLLIAIDFSDASSRAVDVGLQLAAELKARVTLVHVCELPVYAYEGLFFPTTNVVDTLMDAARQRLEAALLFVRQTAPEADTILRQGAPWQQILAAIDEVHADLVVIGTTGHTKLARVLLGSVAERVIRLSPVPVLIAR